MKGDLTCPSCWGTGHWRGWGPPCGLKQSPPAATFHLGGRVAVAPIPLNANEDRWVAMVVRFSDNGKSLIVEAEVDGTIYAIDASRCQPLNPKYTMNQRVHVMPQGEAMHVRCRVRGAATTWIVVDKDGVEHVKPESEISP